MSAPGAAMQGLSRERSEPAQRGLTIAIMQPYFIPYAGYFRLFAAADLFVVYDCVQFPRRGYVHRNRLPDAKGALRWLTMPLAKADRDVRIDALRFRADAREALFGQLAAFPQLAERRSDPAGMVEGLLDTSQRPSDYIEELLRRAASAMALPWRIERSSSLKLPDTLAGQDRILAIARAFGAHTYVNAPGGRTLYDPERFDEQGIVLRFLPDYQGSHASILSRLLAEPAEAVASEIRAGAGLLT